MVYCHSEYQLIYRAQAKIVVETKKFKENMMSIWTDNIVDMLFQYYGFILAFLREYSN